ncbi:MAG TPA: carboxypeptidase-like regulatory domain-containing protein [Thermoanaerobaculia bacterium]
MRPRTARATTNVALVLLVLLCGRVGRTATAAVSTAGRPTSAAAGSQGVSGPLANAPLLLRGRVVRPDGEPIARARIELRPVASRYERGVAELAGALPAPRSSGTSAEDGTFALAVPVAGPWTVTVAAPGFVPMERSLLPLLAAAGLPAVSLEPDSPLRVRIEGPGGEGVAGARVSASDLETEAPAEEIWRPAPVFGLTDRGGDLALPRIAGRSLRLRALAPGELPLVPLLEEVQASEATVRLRLAAGTRCELTLRDVERHPLAALLVGDGEGWALGRSGEDGRVAITVPGWRFSLTVASHDGDLWRELALLFAKGCADGTAAVDLPAPPPAPAGRVVEAASGRALAGALVWPAGDPAAWVRSDASGRYRLRSGSVAEGRELAAVAAGFLTGHGTVGGPAGAAPRAPTLALRAAADLEGSVADGRGHPVARAEVLLAYLGDGPIGARIDREHWRAGAAWSTAGGAFRFTGLPAGALYEVVARLPGVGSCAIARGRLVPGRPRLVLVLRQERGITGRVVDEGGRPIPGARLALSPSWAPPSMSWPVRQLPFLRDGLQRTLSGSDGRFALPDVGASAADLRIRAPGFVPYGRDWIGLSAGRTDLGSIRLSQGVPLRARLGDSGGQPVAGVEVWNLAAVIGGDILRLDDGRPGDPRADWGLLDHAVSDRGGEVAFQVAPENQNVAWLVLCIGGFSPSQEGTSPAELVQIPVWSQTKRLSGWVVDGDGRPIAGAQVEAATALDDHWLQDGISPCALRGGGSAFEARAADRLHRHAETDAQGRFTIGISSQGGWSLTVRAPGFAQASRKIEGVPDPLSDPPLELIMEREAALGGVIATADGAPVAGVRIELSQGGGKAPASAESDGDGRYRIAGLVPGSYVLSLETGSSASSFDAPHEDIELAAGETSRDRRISPSKPLAVDGRVVDAWGRPVGGALVEALEEGRLGAATYSRADGSFGLETTSGADANLDVIHDSSGFAREPGLCEAHDGVISGVVLGVSPRVTIRGRLAGLSREELERAQVGAWVGIFEHFGFYRLGAVSPDGSYRIEGLYPDEWQITARVADRSVDASVTATRERREVEADLVFAKPAEHDRPAGAP